MSDPTFTAEQLREQARLYNESESLFFSPTTGAMLEFAARLVERTTWQPMETAPKDGSLILMRFDGRSPDVGEWFPVTSWARNGWWTCHTMPVHPTGWAALPEEPR